MLRPVEFPTADDEGTPRWEIHPVDPEAMASAPCLVPAGSLPKSLQGQVLDRAELEHHQAG